MNKYITNIYMNSPFFLKKVFANLEAIKRNFYRRSGFYKTHYNNIIIEQIFCEYDPEKQKEKINNLLVSVCDNIPYYQENLINKHLSSMDEIIYIPLTSKSVMKNKIDKFINADRKSLLWKSKTSGSTGNPFNFYRDRTSMQYEYALYDKLYDYFANSNTYNKARISGVPIVKANYKKPPFWYFIKVFNQLQCSAYHIDIDTYKLYLKAFDNYNVLLGTGYAKAWLFLAQHMLAGGNIYRRFKGIVTDSEGLNTEEKSLIEKAFDCPVYQTYGLGEVGIVAVQCKNNNYHILSDRCFVEIIDEDGNVIEDGKMGEIVVTDLYSFDAPFIRYRTGDIGAMGHKECNCGWNTPFIKELCGRVDDYVLTSQGRKISRLSPVAKVAKGVKGMQLIQTEKGKLEIHVLPDDNFDIRSMDDVLKVAEEYLGDIKISWHIVDELEKTKAGKVRYVIRRISNNSL